MTDAVHLSNNPPDDVDPLLDRLRTQHKALFVNLAQLEEKGAEAPAEVHDEASAKVLTDLAAAMSALERKFEKARVEEKEPYLQGSQTVDNTLGSPKKTLETRRKALMSRVNAHHDRVAAAARRAAQEAADAARWEAEEQRRAAEAARAVDSHQEADQLAVDAAKIDAKADAQEKKAVTTQTATTRTDAGTSYQVKTPAYRIPDGDALKASLGPLVAYLDRTAISDALQRACKANPLPEIPGVEFYTHTETRVRAAQGA